MSGVSPGVLGQSASARSDRPPPAATPAIPLEAEAAVLLPIPARAQAKEAPSAGWCGETAIQEGLLHLGVWAPQRLINRAGNPTHPDLYSPDIPVALDGLGVRYTVYAPSRRGFDGFAEWVKRALEEGDPVLAGVKILPTQHPEWGLDHFVLVVGHGPRGLLVNTTWGHRRWVADTDGPGLSFKNAFYGLRLAGVVLPPNAKAARLTLLEENEKIVTLRITCAGLASGTSVRIERHEHRGSTDMPSWSETFTVPGDRIEREVSVESDRPARFRCVPQ